MTVRQPRPILITGGGRRIGLALAHHFLQQHQPVIVSYRTPYPAIDVLRSVSRALPQAASAEENARIARTRNLLGTYAESELMIRAGLYAPGSDQRLDEAVRLYPALDHFLTRRTQDTRHGFRLLDEALSGRVSHD